MKKIIMSSEFLAAIMSVNVCGIGFISVPTSGLEKRQFSLGFNYAYAIMDSVEI